MMPILKTNHDLATFLTGIFKPHAEALQGILEKLPEALRPDFLKLKNDLDQQLAKLAPTDQVPAALDASYALQGFANAMERMQDYALQMTERLSKLAKDYTEKAAAYQELNGKLTAGELLTKAAATELCGVARKEALDSVKPQIVAMRRQQVQLAGLPAAADELLGLPEAEFTALFTDTVKNVATLAARGFKLGGKGDGLVKDLAWQKADAFQGRLTAYDDVLGKAPVAGDPLLGGGAGGKAADATAKPKARAW